jgi:NADH dehydrogenase FAD-containing subunit
VVVSPRSYFVFTPLLASTAVGTLEFRTCLESVRGRYSGVQFFQGWADDVNFSQNKITIEEAAITGISALTFPGDPHTFELGYDKLVVAVGCYSQTFGTKGVSENAFFLKDIGDSRKIRKRILDCKSQFSPRNIC